MGIIKKLLRNTVIFAFTIVFSIAIIFFIKHPDLFQASVLNASENILIQKNKWDIAYKQNQNILDVFFSSKIKTEEITIIFAHNSSIELELNKSSGQCPFTVIDSNEENTKIEIKCEKINYNESVILIPFKGDIQDILIEEAFYSNENSQENLSIGNISNITEHSK